MKRSTLVKASSCAWIHKNTPAIITVTLVFHQLKTYRNKQQQHKKRPAQSTGQVKLEGREVNTAETHMDWGIHATFIQGK